MPIIALLLAAQTMPLPPPGRACEPSQLRLSLDGHAGDFSGMSHAGTRLTIRNLGADCMLPASPVIELRNARGRVLPAVRRATPETPLDVMVPLRLRQGCSLATNLRWVSSPVYPHSRRIRAASVAVRINGKMMHAPLKAILYGEAGKPVTFDQTPMREM